MITLKDCLDYCELSKKAADEAAAKNHEPIIVSIAHHECSLSDNTSIEKKVLVDDIAAPYKMGRVGYPPTHNKKFNTTYTTNRFNEKNSPF